jgi:HEAT repeat protein
MLVKEEPKMLRLGMNTFECVVLVIVLTSGMAYAQAEHEIGYVVFEHTTLEPIPSTQIPKPDAIVDTVSCALARGEYEPIQIGVHALADGLTNIRVTVESDLKVTVYHHINPSIKQQLVSEPGTVVVSEVPGEVYLQRGDVVGQLAAGHSVNFWLLFRADPEASPGVHPGKVRIEPDGRTATELDLKVHVRPFQLAEPRAVFAAYYREDFLPKRFGSWELEDQVALAIYKDMAAHGQNSVTFYHAGDDPTQLSPADSRLVDKSITLASEAGLTRAEIPCVAIFTSHLSPDLSSPTATQMEAAVAWLQTERLKRGSPEIILFGRDEGLYPAFGLRRTYAPLRPLPIRLSTDMSHISPAYAYGDFHDVWTIHDGLLTSELLAEAGRMGAEVWTYSYRIWRQHYSPVTQRYFAGLHTWAHRVGGNWIWAYAHARHSQVWWQPDSNEPMSHMGWEGRREGVDDYRYLQMVEDLVKAKTPDPSAIEAGAWLESLRVRLTRPHINPHEVQAGHPLDIEEYDAIRTTAADYIQKLGPLVDPKESRVVMRLKDEAAAFRGKSLNQCVAGLNGFDASQRRAAAWALFELGSRAAPATPALIRLLDDPEVRFPALHALDAIGPAAYPAASKIASLLSHRDAFVRQGATFALAGLARPRNWDEDIHGYAAEEVSPYAHTVVPPLRQALRDSHEDVRWIAAFGLSRCGEAAAPALPDAMKMATGPSGDQRAAGLRMLCGLGPAAAEAVPHLVKSYAAAKGEDRPVTWTLAAVGPAASDATAVLEMYRTPKNRYLADTCYTLFCIRGDVANLETMVRLLGDKSCPRGASEWRDVVRFLGALGAKAAQVAPWCGSEYPYWSLNLV